jgi:hypothetical protein
LDSFHSSNFTDCDFDHAGGNSGKVFEGLMAIFTTITNVGYYETIREDSASGETEWTINKNARPGDMVLLYVCAPVSAIVAKAIISEEPYLNEDLNSEFLGLYFAEMSGLKMLEKPLTRKELIWEFPHWRYWTQPRNSIQVPKVFEVVLKNLLGEKG